MVALVLTSSFDAVLEVFAFEEPDQCEVAVSAMDVDVLIQNILDRIEAITVVDE
jgi:hypothetical protein